MTLYKAFFHRFLQNSRQYKLTKLALKLTKFAWVIRVKRIFNSILRLSISEIAPKLSFHGFTTENMYFKHFQTGEVRLKGG